MLAEFIIFLTVWKCSLYLTVCHKYVTIWSNNSCEQNSIKQLDSKHDVYDTRPGDIDYLNFSEW